MRAFRIPTRSTPKSALRRKAIRTAPADRAFTFVELILVATIISILAAIAVPNFLEAQVRADFARSKTELALLKIGIESYRLENRHIPYNRESGVADGWDLVALTTPIVYLSSVPSDFFSGDQPYMYLNALQSDPENGLTYSPEVAMRFPGQVYALLWGFGPRRELEIRIGEGGVIERLLKYDPTNGTTSPGDVYERLP